MNKHSCSRECLLFFVNYFGVFGFPVYLRIIPFLLAIVLLFRVAFTNFHSYLAEMACTRLSFSPYGETTTCLRVLRAFGILLAEQPLG